MPVQRHIGAELVLEKAADELGCGDELRPCFFGLGSRLHGSVLLALLHDVVPLGYQGTRIAVFMADGYSARELPRSNLDDMAGVLGYPRLASDPAGILRLRPRPFELLTSVLCELLAHGPPERFAGTAGSQFLQMPGLTAYGYKISVFRAPDEWIGYDAFLRTILRAGNPQSVVREQTAEQIYPGSDIADPLQTVGDEPSKSSDANLQEVNGLQSRPSQVEPAAIGWALYLEPRVVFSLDGDLAKAVDGIRAPQDLEKAVASEIFDSTEVRVCADGLVVALTSDVLKAYGLLAEFSALLTFAGVGQVAPRMPELMRVDGVNSLGYPDNWQSLNSLNRISKYALPAPFQEPLFVVHTDTASEILRLMLDARKEIADVLRRAVRFSQADTLFHHGYWTESFLVTWTLLEEHLRTTCMDLFRTKGYSKTRVDSTIKDGNWGVSQFIDVLFAAGQIDQSRADALHALRKSRNNAVHRVAMLAREDAERCLRLAHQVLVPPSIAGAKVFRVVPYG